MLDRGYSSIYTMNATAIFYFVSTTYKGFLGHLFIMWWTNFSRFQFANSLKRKEKPPALFLFSMLTKNRLYTFLSKFTLWAKTKAIWPTSPDESDIKLIFKTRWRIKWLHDDVLYYKASIVNRITMVCCLAKFTIQWWQLMYCEKAVIKWVIFKVHAKSVY